MIAVKTWVLCLLQPKGSSAVVLPTMCERPWSPSAPETIRGEIIWTRQALSPSIFCCRDCHYCISHPDSTITWKALQHKHPLLLYDSLILLNSLFFPRDFLVLLVIYHIKGAGELPLPVCEIIPTVFLGWQLRKWETPGNKEGNRRTQVCWPALDIWWMATWRTFLGQMRWRTCWVVTWAAARLHLGSKSWFGFSYTEKYGYDVQWLRGSMAGIKELSPIAGKPWL